MQYFFFLGSNPSISVAELAKLLPNFSDNKVRVYPEQSLLLFEGDLPMAPEKLIRRLGGTIKIGLVIEEGAKPSQFLSILKGNFKNTGTRHNFGFSDHTGNLRLKAVAMEYKKFLKEQDVPCRWVVSQEPILSSVVVEQNDLLTKGVEMVFFKDGAGYSVGKTLAVQAFKELSWRDYGRPARDDHSGMLPPKLAQIMLNLANVSEKSVILDPFCGSGTVISEAALFGVKRLFGSDISPKAIADTQTNLDWLKKQAPDSNFELKLSNISADKVSQFLPAASVDAIVTEPYLGPQRGLNDIRAVVKDLESLYKSSLAEMYKILKPDGRIVMLWPVFWNKKEPVKLNTEIASGYMIIPPLPEFLSGKLRLTERRTLLYGRSDQRVWREILILEKK
ncbi:methyltransferase domain-containing protein [Candidatus Falkowbacteria bacterium]|nr:methyltransferase domain-containing protein [Candidatus Falkowbacteria bacterium]